jgi:hypothetical protein
LDNTGVVQIEDGTSFSAPYMTGLCALFASTCRDASPAEIKTAILESTLEGITYNKPSTTYALAQNPMSGSVLRTAETSPILEAGKILTLQPYYVSFDGTKMCGKKLELTTNDITSVILSVGKQESSSSAMLVRLQP